MFQNITPITKNIIILNVIVFILAMLIPQSYQYLAAFFPTSPYFKSWQIITHMFMHGGFMHIAFNMLTFASFGPVLERFLGEKKFVILYFLSGLGAFVLFNLWEYYQLYQDAQPLIVEGLQFSDILRNNNQNSGRCYCYLLRSLYRIYDSHFLKTQIPMKRKYNL